MKFFAICIVSLFFWNASLQAQIVPPDFLCVKGDTVVWSLPNNTCGAFQGLEIYISDTRPGPYTLLTTITNITQTEYINAIPGIPLKYYYLRSQYACPGNFSVPTDTFSKGADPNGQVEIYYVLAMDACDIKGPFDNFHNTMLLNVVTDPCTREAILTWNPYLNWANGLDAYEIFVSIDGAAPVLVDTTIATRFVYGGLDDDRDYCFTVVARESVTNNRASSTVSCFRSQVIQPVGDLCLELVTVELNGDVTLNWRINSNAALQRVRILSGSSPDNLDQVIFEETNPVFTSNNQTFTDTRGLAGAGIVYYRIETIDNCGDNVSSNLFPTIFLSGAVLPGRQNRAFWEQDSTQGQSVLDHEIFRVEGSNIIFISRLNAAAFEFTESLSGPATGNTQFCYVLISNLEQECTGVLPLRSQSNVHCVEQNSTLLFPNALVPGGFNDEFKPVILYRESINSYELHIFDRYGGQVFTTSDPDTAWKGTKGGKELPLGAYSYRVKATQTSGRIIEQTGTVFLVK
ncbi:MAG: gliding motility-associated C-terminal domain-containing protein [Saprospiraceae bacterium]|nr:gliding motility-associated C-terminal domain-containing protein [Saprospiraceae bacterium]